MKALVSIDQAKTKIRKKTTNILKSLREIVKERNVLVTVVPGNSPSVHVPGLFALTNWSMLMAEPSQFADSFRQK